MIAEKQGQKEKKKWGHMKLMKDSQHANDGQLKESKGQQRQRRGKILEHDNTEKDNAGSILQISLIN